MENSIRSCISRSITLSRNLVTAENLLDTRTNDTTRQIILRMARGTDKQRVEAVGTLAAMKLGELREVGGEDEESISRIFMDCRQNYSQGASMLTANASVNPWMCAFLCALCAVAILDGAPGDEVVACALCMNTCARATA